MIEIKNITKAYDENVIFQNYNLKIKKGSKILLLPLNISYLIIFQSIIESYIGW